MANNWFRMELQSMVGSTELVHFKVSGPNEVRRFTLDRQLSLDRRQVQKKIGELFPHLHAQTYHLTWTDSDGDAIRVESDQELAIALAEMPTMGKFSLVLAEPRTQGDHREAQPSPSVEASTVVHVGVSCDGCDQGIWGHRYKCVVCPDYDLCMACEGRGLHAAHVMLRMARPDMAWPPHLFRRLGKMQKRCDRRKTQAEMGEEALHDPYLLLEAPGGRQNPRLDLAHLFNKMVDGWLGLDLNGQCQMGAKGPCPTGSETDPAPTTQSTGQAGCSDPRLAQLAQFLMDIPQTQAKKPASPEQSAQEPARPSPGPVEIPVTVTQNEAAPQPGTSVEIPVMVQTAAAPPAAPAAPTVAAADQRGEPLKTLPVLEEDWTLLKNDSTSGNIAVPIEVSDQPASVLYPELPPTPARTPSANPRIQTALDALVNMGFKNEDGWLTSLVEAKDGDIGRVLDMIHPATNIRR